MGSTASFPIFFVFLFVFSMRSEFKTVGSLGGVCGVADKHMISQSYVPKKKRFPNLEFMLNSTSLRLIKTFQYYSQRIFESC